MNRIRFICLTIAVLTLAIGATVPAGAAGATPSLRLDGTHITISGTTNVHPYTVSTSTIRVLQLAVATGEGDAIENALQPGGVQALEFAIAAASLTSGKNDMDKNMYKALKVEQSPDITFRLTRLEPQSGVEHGYHAVGVLRLAGGEREVGFDLLAERKGDGVAIRGEFPLLMTDFGIVPPKAMLGMLKTDPKVTIQFETVLASR
jgi:hypothetical protein